jgi:cell division protein FtsL
MKIKRRQTESNVHESFSDIALLMLATFIFLLVTILITSRVQETVQVPRLKEKIHQLEGEVADAEKNNDRLNRELGQLAGTSTDAQIEAVLQSVGLNSGKGRHDFDLFVKGIKDLPGKDIHMVVDATGSMHGASTFLVPLLRVIVIRSGKELSAITWFADGEAQTYQGTMGEMFDSFMKGAPFVGNSETIGDAFFKAAKNAHVPGAYVLLGDEPSDDRIYYLDIPAPVFTIPIGRDNPSTRYQFKMLADKTGGKMLQLEFK